MKFKAIILVLSMANELAYDIDRDPMLLNIIILVVNSFQDLVFDFLNNKMHLAFVFVLSIKLLIVML